jgi:hypothetical protein
MNRIIELWLSRVYSGVRFARARGGFVMVVAVCL